MAFEFKLPDVGEGIAEAEIVEWLVSEGDFVKEYQTLLKIETDKAIVDLPSPFSGALLKINFKKGDKVNVGSVLCVIGEKGEKTESKFVKESESSKLKMQTEEIKIEGKVLASPSVRKAAREKGIEIGTLKGSGQNGQILMSDIEKPNNVIEIVESKSSELISQKKYDNYGYIERVPFKSVRKVIAQNLIRSLKESAQVTSMEDINVDKLWKIRNKEKEHFAIEGIKLTFMPFVIKALIKALQKHPILNSSLVGEEIIIKKYYNIGVAVQTDAGLIVFVLKIADQKSIAQIAKEMEELAKKARNRTIDQMDLTGGTFTITNYGSVGGNYATPIINPPEAAILGLGRIFDRAVFDEKSGKVRNVKILPISLTFDHQILDGAEANEFIETLKGYLEEPEHLLEK